jgi:hypothetical protein
MNPMKEKTNKNMTDFSFIVNTEVLNFEYPLKRIQYSFEKNQN